MLISHSHKFIFIHNYKVAGTSINALLNDYQPWHMKNKLLKHIKIKMHKYKILNKKIHAHATANEIKKLLPSNMFTNYYKFGFVRNPWDLQISLYHYMLQTKNHFQHNIALKFKTFDEYIEWRCFSDKHFQKDFFIDNSNNIIVDYIGKIENIENDIEHIFLNVGIKNHPIVPKKNTSKHDNYKKYYSEKSYNLVLHHFKEDIDLFGYEF